MSIVVFDARTARMGGGLAFVESLAPRLEARMVHRGLTHRTLRRPATVGEWGAVHRDMLDARAILHVGNRATIPTRARQVVCVRDRLRVAPWEDPNRACVAARLRRMLLRQALEVADAVVVPTASMVELVEAMQGRRRAPIQVIHHGAPNWPSVPARPFGDPVRLLYPSHVGPHKNFELLLHLLEMMTPNTSRRYRLTLTATGGEELMRGVQLRQVFASVGDQLSFVGPVARAQLPALYQDHDILVFPSLVESFGLPLVEAMVSGMPILTSDRPWAREVAGAAASYADPRDVEPWVECLERHRASGVRGNPAGQSRAERFDWEVAADRYEALLLDV